MSVVVLKANPTKEDIGKARQEYPSYIKITADISQGIVLIGGEYHADSEKILIEEYGSKQSDIWGGGYDITLDKYQVNALVNLRSGINDSMDILDPETRNTFLKLVKQKLAKIKSLT